MSRKRHRLALPAKAHQEGPLVLQDETPCRAIGAAELVDLLCARKLSVGREVQCEGGVELGYCRNAIEEAPRARQVRRVDAKRLIAGAEGTALQGEALRRYREGSLQDHENSACEQLEWQAHDSRLSDKGSWLLKKRVGQEGKKSRWEKDQRFSMME